MKIIKQSHVLYKEFNSEIPPTEKELIQKIGSSSRICYKSEDKAKEDETGFVKNLIKRGHNSCLEMASISILVSLECQYRKDLLKFISMEIPYLKIDLINTKNNWKFLVSGSIRSFRELLTKREYKYEIVFSMINNLLINQYPILFEDIEKIDDVNYEICEIDLINVNAYQSTYPDYFTNEIYKRHTFQGVKFITNRAVSHELVRHRPNGLLQESQRYCCYNLDKFGNEITFIQPSAFPYLMEEAGYADWKETMEFCESKYFKALERGASAQAARTMLPNSCKTEIIVYTDLRQWEHIFKMRAINPAAEPSMKEAMIPVYKQFKILYPKLFNNLQVKICN